MSASPLPIEIVHMILDALEPEEIFRLRKLRWLPTCLSTALHSREGLYAALKRYRQYSYRGPLKPLYGSAATDANGRLASTDEDAITMDELKQREALAIRHIKGVPSRWSKFKSHEVDFIFPRLRGKYMAYWRRVDDAYQLCVLDLLTHSLVLKMPLQRPILAIELTDTLVSFATDKNLYVSTLQDVSIHSFRVREIDYIWRLAGAQNKIAIAKQLYINGGLTMRFMVYDWDTDTFEKLGEDQSGCEYQRQPQVLMMDGKPYIVNVKLEDNIWLITTSSRGRETGVRKIPTNSMAEDCRVRHTGADGEWLIVHTIDDIDLGLITVEHVVVGPNMIDISQSTVPGRYWKGKSYEWYRYGFSVRQRKGINRGPDKGRVFIRNRAARRTGNVVSWTDTLMNDSFLVIIDERDTDADESDGYNSRRPLKTVEIYAFEDEAVGKAIVAPSHDGNIHECCCDSKDDHHVLIE